MENKCPKCGHDLGTTENSKELKFCLNCGASINEEKKEEHSFCPHCGNKRTDSTNICSHCGKEIEKPKEEPKPYQAAAKIPEPNFPPLQDVSKPDVVSNGYAGGLYNGDGDSTAKKDIKPAFENPTGEPVSPASPEDEMKPKTVNPPIVNTPPRETSRNVFDIVNNVPQTPTQSSLYGNNSQQDIFKMVNQASQPQTSYGSYVPPQQQSYNPPPAYNNYNAYPQNNYQQPPAYGGYIPPQQPSYNPPPQYSRPVPEHRSYKETSSYSGGSRDYDPLDDYRNYKNTKEPASRREPVLRTTRGKDGSMTGIYIMSALLLVFIGVGIYYWFFLR